MSSIRKSTNRPFACSVARKLTISASALLACIGTGMGRTASAAALAVCFEPRPARIVANTTSPSARAALNKYGWNAFAAGSNANAFTASRSITAMIETALITRMLTVDPF